MRTEGTDTTMDLLRAKLTHAAVCMWRNMYAVWYSHCSDARGHTQLRPSPSIQSHPMSRCARFSINQSFRQLLSLSVRITPRALCTPHSHHPTSMPVPSVPPAPPVLGMTRGTLALPATLGPTVTYRMHHTIPACHLLIGHHSSPPLPPLASIVVIYSRKQRPSPQLPPHDGTAVS